jgi:hypothetical protein
MTDSPLAALMPQPDTPSNPSALDTLTQILGGYQKLDQDRAALRQQQLEMARESLQQQRKGLSAADLFRLSAALAMPQRYKGFGGMMANVSPVLAEVAGEHEQASAARRNALQRLQEQYLGGSIDDQGKSLSNRLEVARAMASAQPDRPRQTWSEGLGRFVSPDERQPVGRVVNNGMVGIKYSDGTEEYADTDGTVAVYDAAGRKIATRKGNSTNAAP